MIQFGVKSVNLGNSWKNVKHEVIRGYYLVLPNGNRYWFAETISDARNGALTDICDKHLTETEYQYWVDYCHGYDVFGNLAWENLDQTDRII